MPEQRGRGLSLQEGNFLDRFGQLGFLRNPSHRARLSATSGRRTEREGRLEQRARARRETDRSGQPSSYTKVR